MQVPQPGSFGDIGSVGGVTSSQLPSPQSTDPSDYVQSHSRRGLAASETRRPSGAHSLLCDRGGPSAGVRPRLDWQLKLVWRSDGRRLEPNSSER